MIQVIDRANAHEHRDALRAFSVLRYEVFIGRLGWDIACREPGYEEDEFDDENAVYLTAADATGEIVGGARLLDTSKRSLLAELFSHLVSGPVPADPAVFEVTRFLVAPRRRDRAPHGDVCAEMLWGLQAYGIWAGLSHLVSVPYLGIEPILRRAGYRFQRLGPVREVDGSPVAALRHEVDPAVLEHARRRMSVSALLLTPGAAGEASRRPRPVGLIAGQAV